jgi:hypothetical protein
MKQLIVFWISFFVLLGTAFGAQLNNFNQCGDLQAANKSARIAASLWQSALEHERNREEIYNDAEKSSSRAMWIGGPSIFMLSYASGHFVATKFFNLAGMALGANITFRASFDDLYDYLPKHEFKRLVDKELSLEQIAEVIEKNSDGLTAEKLNNMRLSLDESIVSLREQEAIEQDELSGNITDRLIDGMTFGAVEAEYHGRLLLFAKTQKEIRWLQVMLANLAIEKISINCL